MSAKPTQDVAEIKQNLITQVNTRTLFEASIRYIIEQGISTFVEIGPGTVLKGLLRKIDKSLEIINIEKPDHITSFVPPSEANPTTQCHSEERSDEESQVSGSVD